MSGIAVGSRCGARRGGPIAALCLLLLWFGRAGAVELPERMQLFVGESRTLAASPVRMAVGNGRVISVTLVDPRQLLVLGESPGSTVLQLWLRDGREARISIDVSASNVESLLEDVRGLIAGAEGLSARLAAGRVVLEGEGLGAAARARAAAVAALYPALVLDFTGRLGAEATVQIDARIVELRRGSLRDLGVRWRGEANGPNAGVVADLAVNDLFRPQPPESPVPPGTIPPGARVWPPRGYFGLSSVLDSRLALLEQRGELAVLAEPSLSCRSGGSARFVSGGEIPIPVVSGTGAADVEFREYGVILDVRPVVDSSGTIFARIETEISQVDDSQRVLGVPGLLKRRSATDVTLREGETLVLAGLVSQFDSRDRQAIPGLGRLPLAGRAFRADQRRRERTELVIFMTPRLIRPAAAEAASPPAFAPQSVEALEDEVRGAFQPEQGR
jgi:pilus assembly protein CpaC